MRQINPIAFILLFTLCLLANTNSCHASNLLVSYQPATTHISISAHHATLKNLMTEISAQTSVLISVSAQVQQLIDIHIDDTPLDEALIEIARIYHLNHLLIHAKFNGKTTLREMKILPRITTTETQQSAQSNQPQRMTAEEKRALFKKYSNEQRHKLKSQITFDDPRGKKHHLKNEMHDNIEPKLVKTPESPFSPILLMRPQRASNILHSNN